MASKTVTRSIRLNMEEDIDVDSKDIKTEIQSARQDLLPAWNAKMWRILPKDVKREKKIPVEDEKDTTEDDDFTFILQTK